MGIGKEARTSLIISLLQTPVHSKDEMNKLAGLVRSFGFEYGFDEPEIRYHSYQILLGITKSKTAQAKMLLETTSGLLFTRNDDKS